MSRSTHEPEPTDVELVRRAQLGAAAAFTELVARYQDRVYNTCYRMCHHHADAADLTQATFLRALEALPTFENRASFFTWLFRIAVNLTLSQRRQRVRHATLSLDPPAGEDGRQPDVVSHEPDAAGRAEQSELHERVGRALTQLDEEFRAAVILKDIEDLDYATIAEILAVPVGTVKSRIHRGRSLLRELLRDERTPVARP